MNKVDSFRIRIYSFDNDNIFDISKGKIIKELYPKTSHFNIHPDVLKADPFLFAHHGVLYLFYERQTYWKPGVIEMISTTDLQTWTKPQIVLKEKCHLSYPYVFTYDGSIYMIPETHKLKEIRLYKANESKTSFTFCRTLIKDGNSYVDSSVFISSDKIYLFTTSIDTETRLHLFISDKLEGPYIEHIKSPIARGLQYGRNGGGVISVNNGLYRINQNCNESYGGNVNLFKINDITPDTYKETLYIENLFPMDNSFYKDGGHHFSMAYFNGKTIVATDGKETRSFFLAQLNTNLKNKIKFLFKPNNQYTVLK